MVCIEYKGFYQGRVSCNECEKDSPYLTLRSALMNALNDSSYVFIILEGYIMAFISTVDYIYVFHSHAPDSRNTFCMHDPNGPTAIVIYFVCIYFIHYFWLIWWIKEPFSTWLAYRQLLSGYSPLYYYVICHYFCTLSILTSKFFIAWLIYWSFIHSCWSSIGRSGGKQRVSLGKGCERKGIAIHELMHVLGFFHEQSRLDRDKYVTVYWSNVDKGKMQKLCTEGGGGGRW